MSTLLSVPRSEWKTFFDAVSKAMLGKWAEIEVASLELGDQIAADWIPMLGITYDTHDDVLEVVLDRASHVIRHPREVVTEEGPNGLTSVAVIDGEGARQVVRLKNPLMLPGR